MEFLDTEGQAILVEKTELATNDWSLTPGCYVGVAPEEEHEKFDFRKSLHEIHEEMDEMNAEAATLAATIEKNFEALGT